MKTFNLTIQAIIRYFTVFINQKHLVNLILLSFSVFCYDQNHEGGEGASADLGTNNTVIGVNAGDSLSTGSNNSFFGQNAGFANV